MAMGVCVSSDGDQGSVAVELRSPPRPSRGVRPRTQPQSRILVVLYARKGGVFQESIEVKDSNTKLIQVIQPLVLEPEMAAGYDVVAVNLERFSSSHCQAFAIERLVCAKPEDMVQELLRQQDQPFVCLHPTAEHTLKEVAGWTCLYDLAPVQGAYRYPFTVVVAPSRHSKSRVMRSYLEQRREEEKLAAIPE